jgi:crossover junction endonuclease MUS81
LPDSESDEPEAKKKKAAPKKPPKQYIPQRGSGGYGILMALVLAIDRPELGTTVYLTKSEVIKGAKEYSDSSYEHSEKGTYFTAWSGMKTLVGKGLVYMTGNPNKFCLTEEG